MEIPFSLSRPHQHRKIRNVEVFPSSDCAHFPFPWNFVIRKIFIHLIWCSANQSKPSQQQNKERNVYNLQMNGVSLFRHISTYFHECNGWLISIIADWQSLNRTIKLSERFFGFGFFPWHKDATVCITRITHWKSGFMLDRRVDLNSLPSYNFLILILNF
jgi:hypothetical protein